MSAMEPKDTDRMTLITLHKTSVTEHALSPLTRMTHLRGIEKILFLSYRGDIILKAKRAVSIAPRHADIVRRHPRLEGRKTKILFKIFASTPQGVER